MLTLEHWVKGIGEHKDRKCDWENKYETECRLTADNPSTPIDDSHNKILTPIISTGISYALVSIDFLPSNISWLKGFCTSRIANGM